MLFLVSLYNGVLLGIDGKEEIQQTGNYIHRPLLFGGGRGLCPHRDFSNEGNCIHKQP